MRMRGEPELAREVQALLAGGGVQRIRIQGSSFLGSRCGTAVIGPTQLRLFCSGAARFASGLYRTMETAGPVGTLKVR